MSAEIQPSTPAAQWRVKGEPDPHGSHYDGERAKLALGSLTDDELANAVFIHYDIRPPLQDIIDGKAFIPIVYVTAAKERIRWLSRALVKATTVAPAAPAHEPLTANEAISLHATYDWIKQQGADSVARNIEPILAKLAALDYLNNVIGGEYIKAKS